MRKVLFLICAALLAWMIWSAGPQNLWQSLLAWNWAIVGGIAVWGGGYVLNTASLGVVIGCLRPEESKTPISRFSDWLKEVFELFSLTVGGYALNYVTPFGLLGGEPWRIYQLRRTMDPKAANSAVAYYALMHIGSHVVLWLMASLYALWLIGDAIREYYGWLFGSVILVIALSVLIVRIGSRKGWLLDLRDLWFNHPRQLCAALLLELLSRLVNVVEYWLLLCFAFPDSTLSTYGAAFLVVAFSSLFANILFFSPLQMGSREGGICLILQMLMPEMEIHALLPIAVSISFATRIREFFWILFGMFMIRWMPSQQKN